MNWIHDPHPNQPPRVTPRQAVTKKSIDTVPRNNNHTVPRNTNKLQQKEGTNQVHNKANSSSLPPKRKRDRKHRRERRARERENRNESFIHDVRWVNQRSLVPASSSVPVSPSGHRPYIVHADGSVPASRICR